LLLLVSTQTIVLGDKSTCDDINALPPACGFDFEWWKVPSCGGGTMLVDIHDVNDAGMVVGRIDGCPSHTQYRILIWYPDAPAPTIINLPWSSSEWATGVNNKGQIVLRALSNGPSTALMDGDEITVLPKPDWANNANTGKINDAGMIVGQYGNSVTGPYPLLARWSPPDYELEDLSPSFPEDVYAQFIVGLAEDGRVGGTAWRNETMPAYELHRAFLFDDGVVTLIDPPPGAINSMARGMSSAGHIVGVGASNIPGTPVWNTLPHVGFVWKDGVMTLLEPYPLDAPVYHFEPRAVNASGTVSGRTIGYSRDAVALGSAANLWFSGVPHLVSELLPLPPGVTAGSPYAVADSGVLAGNGTARGPTGAWAPTVYRAIPRHRPTGDLNNDCVVNGDDLTLVLQSWGKTRRGAVDVPADLNGDGIVDGADLGILLLNWTIE